MTTVPQKVQWSISLMPACFVLLELTCTVLHGLRQGLAFHTISEIAGLVQKQKSRTPVSGLTKLIPDYDHTDTKRDVRRWKAIDATMIQIVVTACVRRSATSR